MSTCPRLTRHEVPAYLLTMWGLRCCLHSMLAKLAVNGGGPAFRKTGRDVYYHISALDTWAPQKLGPAAGNRDRASRHCRHASARRLMQVLEKRSQRRGGPFFDGSEADHGGVNADQALALDTAALLKGSAR